MSRCSGSGGTFDRLGPALNPVDGDRHRVRAGLSPDRIRVGQPGERHRDRRLCRHVIASCCLRARAFCSSASAPRSSARILRSSSSRSSASRRSCARCAASWADFSRCSRCDSIKRCPNSPGEFGPTTAGAGVDGLRPAAELFEALEHALNETRGSVRPVHPWRWLASRPPESRVASRAPAPRAASVTAA